MRRVIAVLMLLAMCGISVLAQALAANEVYVNKPFQLAWTHDGINTNEYRLFRNGTQIATAAVTARTGGDIILDAAGTTGLAVGSYTFRLDAAGDGGVTPSANFVVVVKALPPNPNVPTNIRIIRQ